MKTRLFITGLVGFSSFLLLNPAQTQTVYFQAGARENQAFVIPMTNSNHIAAARAELQKPDTQRWYVGARVAHGSDGINRNFAVVGKPLWNWHITEFGSFGSSAAELVFPSQIEEDPAFYDYILRCCRLDKELSIAEIFYLNGSLSNGVFHLTWPQLGGNYVYTVERASVENPAAWSPVAGFPWPTTTNTISIPATNSQPQLFRVITNSP